MCIRKTTVNQKNNSQFKSEENKNRIARSDSKKEPNPPKKLGN